MNNDELKKKLYNEVSFWLTCLTIISIIVGGTIFVTNIKSDTRILEAQVNNHMESINKSIKKLNEQDEKKTEAITQIQLDIREIMTILEK